MLAKERTARETGQTLNLPVLQLPPTSALVQPPGWKLVVEESSLPPGKKPRRLLPRPAGRPLPASPGATSPRSREREGGRARKGGWGGERESSPEITVRVDNPEACSFNPFLLLLHRLLAPEHAEGEFVDPGLQHGGELPLHEAVLPPGPLGVLEAPGRFLAAAAAAVHLEAQAPPSMGFARQEYWSGVPSPSLS